jgi:hypothetical protein
MAKTTKGYQGDVPFDANGNLMHFPETWRSSITWKPSFVFADTLELLPGVTSGRSAKYVHWRSTTTGVTHPMFASDLVDVVRTGIAAGGLKTGQWTFVKRGMNFGLTALP